MAGAAAPLSIASSAMSVFGSIAGGSAQQQGDEYQAQQAENAATVAKTQAAQTSTFMSQDLERQIQNIQAVRASAGVESSSPTGEAIVNNVRARGQQQIGIKVSNDLNQATTDQDAAQFYMASGQNALLGGILGGVGSLFGGLAGAAKSMNVGGGYVP